MKLLSTVFVLAAICFLCGCSSVKLPNGKYSTTLPGREDFAVVYDDHIHFWLRNPKGENGTGGYFEWAGKFKVGDDKRLIFDMNRQTKRFMNFYYDMRMEGNGIRVEDTTGEQTYMLEFHPAQQHRRSQQNYNMPVESNTGVYR